MPKSKTYEEFVEKFKPKKTTDDCYTPEAVYEVIKGWVCEEYDQDPDNIVRPFWPGGDYEAFDYPEDCLVLDNPPFSILSNICKFYLDKGIKFFLFAPSLTCFSGKDICMQITHIFTDSDITYENGAVVRTAFVTNLAGDIVAQTEPKLGRLIAAVQPKPQPLPKYEYPDHIVTGALLQKYASKGIRWKIRRRDCVKVSALDAQKDKGKTIFGSDLLLSDRKAQQHRQIMERCREREREREKTFGSSRPGNVTLWPLSQREKAIVAGLGGRAHGSH